MDDPVDSANHTVLVILVAAVIILITNLWSRQRDLVAVQQTAELFAPAPAQDQPAGDSIWGRPDASSAWSPAG